MLEPIQFLWVGPRLSRLEQLSLQSFVSHGHPVHLFTYGPVPIGQADQVPLKETEIGEVPEYWSIKKVGDFFEVQGGYSFKSKDFTPYGVPVFRISNVSFGKGNWRNQY